MKNSNNINPVAIYSNPELQKKEILQENKAKSGVYRWTNKVSGKSYVGSGVDLGRRLKLYYKSSHLTKKKMLINRALKKHGHENFTLEILEYCSPSDAISREQHFLDLLKPKYNILRTAGSSLGFRHSEETLIKMKAENHPLFGKTHSEETKAKMSEAQKGKNNPFFGKTHSGETKAKISAAQGTSLKVLDLETNEKQTYCSMNKAAEALGITRPALCYHFKKTNCFLFKDRYQIEKEQKNDSKGP